MKKRGWIGKRKPSYPYLFLSTCHEFWSSVLGCAYDRADNVIMKTTNILLFANRLIINIHCFLFFPLRGTPRFSTTIAPFVVEEGVLPLRPCPRIFIEFYNPRFPVVMVLLWFVLKDACSCALPLNCIHNHFRWNCHDPWTGGFVCLPLGVPTLMSVTVSIPILPSTSPQIPSPSLLVHPFFSFGFPLYI